MRSLCLRGEIRAILGLRLPLARTVKLILVSAVDNLRADWVSLNVFRRVLNSEQLRRESSLLVWGQLLPV